MKKIVLAIAILTSVTAMAGSVSVEGTTAENVAGKQSVLGYSLSATETVSKNLDVGVGLSTSQAETTNAVGSRLELSLTPKINMGRINMAVKTAVGVKLSGAGSANFYSVEPNISVPVTSDLTLKMGYRFRSMIDQNLADTTRTARLGLSYGITKSDSLYVRYDAQRGDSENNSWNFGYTHNF